MFRAACNPLRAPERPRLSVMLLLSQRLEQSSQQRQEARVRAQNQDRRSNLLSTFYFCFDIDVLHLRTTSRSLQCSTVSHVCSRYGAVITCVE